jgi:hypothetical protein
MSRHAKPASHETKISSSGERAFKSKDVVWLGFHRLLQSIVGLFEAGRQRVLALSSEPEVEFPATGFQNGGALRELHVLLTLP